MTQPHQVDNKGGAPKINDGVSGGNTTASTVPSAGPTTSSTYTNTPQQPVQPTAPAGTLYDPKSARPGSTVPGADGKTVTPGDFSVDKQIKDLADPKGGLTAPGSNPLAERANANPLDTFSTGGPARGGNQSKGGLASESSVPDTPEVTKAKNEGWAEALRREGGTPTGNWQKDMKETDYAQRAGTDHYAATKDMSEKERADYWSREEFKQKIGTTAGSPDPSKDTGDGHGMKYMVGTNTGPQMTPAQIEAERRRQVTQPNETGGPPDRMHMDNAAQQNVSGRQGNLINPERGDGTTTALGTGPLPGSDPRTPNNPTGSSQGGTTPRGPGDPSETCAANKSC